MGNGGRGVFIYNGADNNVIGGTDPGEGNVIADNQQTGVAVGNGDGNAIHGNFIGTDAGGTIDLGNGADGVRLIGSCGQQHRRRRCHRAGQLHPLQRGRRRERSDGKHGQLHRVQRHRGQRGHRGGHHATTPPTSTASAMNAVYNNGGLAIDLMADGVTPNDGNNDNPAKANRGYNFPVFSSSRAAAGQPASSPSPAPPRPTPMSSSTRSARPRTPAGTARAWPGWGPPTPTQPATSSATWRAPAWWTGTTSRPSPSARRATPRARATPASSRKTPG